MFIVRRKTRLVKVGTLSVGSDSPISVQSMANASPHDFDACLVQAIQLQNAGCDILRFAVPDKKSAQVFSYLKNNGITMPLVADIHFDYRLAVECAFGGADKIRINPGNIGSEDKIKQVVDACRTNKVPIRIGVNSGSLEKHILAKYGSPTPEALVESALFHASLLEKLDFYDIVVSMKASNPVSMIAANRRFAEKSDIPLHLGVTEAGSEKMGTVKSAVGIGSLLCDGIGDTVRVSLTSDPVNEIQAANSILAAAGYSKNGLNIVACPTCGRTRINLIELLAEFEKRAQTEVKINKPITVAIMGCVVNGPGEAKEADIGIAGGVGEAVLIKKGFSIRKIKEQDIIGELISEINSM